MLQYLNIVIPVPVHTSYMYLGNVSVLLLISILNTCVLLVYAIPTRVGTYSIAILVGTRVHVYVQWTRVSILYCTRVRTRVRTRVHSSIATCTRVLESHCNNIAGLACRTGTVVPVSKMVSPYRIHKFHVWSVFQAWPSMVFVVKVWIYPWIHKRYPKPG